MRTRLLLIAAGLGLAVVIAACTPAELTRDDVEAQTFMSNDDLVAWIDCDGMWIATPDGVGPAAKKWTSEQVVDASREAIAGEPSAKVADALRAGNIWVLVDSSGRPFGGLEPGAQITFCV